MGISVSTADDGPNEPGYVLVAEQGGDVLELQESLKSLTRHGHRVRVLVRRTGFHPDLTKDVRRYVVRRAPGGPRPPARFLPQRVAGLLRPAAVTPDARRRAALEHDLRSDPKVVVFLRQADVVVPVDATSRAVVPGVLAALGAGARLASVEDVLVGHVHRLLDEELPRALAAVEAPLSPSPARRLARALERVATPPTVPLDRRRWVTLVGLLAALNRQGRQDVSDRLLTALSRWPGPDDAGLDAWWRLHVAQVELTVQGRTDEDVVDLVRDVAPDLDHLLAAGEVDDLVDRLGAVLAVLFHRELHVDGERSRLVDEPDAFLGPLRSTEVWRLLHPSTPEAPPIRRGPTQPVAGRARVAVLPGSYPRFAAGVVEALREVVDTTVVDTSAHRRSVGMGVDPDLLRTRVHQAMGLPWDADPVLLEATESMDVVFLDWADRAALHALMAVPAGARVVLRIHSVDALSPVLHLLDWSRVDAVVFVSGHIKDLVTRQLRDTLRGTEVHVVPNAVQLERYGAPKTAGAEHRLVMVGWAQRVKDPIWALEVLGRLRQSDPRWVLTLVGDDFPTEQLASGRAYAARFRARLAEPDVLGGVEFVPYTDDVPAQLARAGYVLSASVRESFHVGLVEGAAAGAVPVVRDWPMFSRLGGARGLFPDEWVVASVEEAVRRVEGTAQPEVWHEASEAARREVARRFSYVGLSGIVQDAVLGPVIR